MHPALRRSADRCIIALGITLLFSSSPLPSRQLPHPSKRPPRLCKKKKDNEKATRASLQGLALCRGGGPRTAKFPASSVHHPPPNNGAILPPLGLDSSTAPCGLDPTRPLPRRDAGLQKLPLGWSHCFPLESRFIGFPLPPPRTRGWTNSFWSETLGALNSDKKPCDKHDISLKCHSTRDFSTRPLFPETPWSLKILFSHDGGLQCGGVEMDFRYMSW